MTVSPSLAHTGMKLALLEQHVQQSSRGFGPDPSVAEKFIYLGLYATVIAAVGGFFILLLPFFTRWQQRRAERKAHRLPAEAGSQEANGAVPQYQEAVLPDIPLAQQFLAIAKKSGDQVALVRHEQDAAMAFAGVVPAPMKVTYKALAEKVTGLAATFVSLGCKKGDVVMLMIDRGMDQVAIVYAAMLSGLVWVPVDPSVPEDRLGELLSDGQPSLVICQDSAGAKRTERLASARVLDVTGMWELEKNLPASQKDVSKLPVVSLADPCLLIYTSGSTGKPKGILYSNEMANHGSGCSVELTRMTDKSVALLKTPYIWAVVEYELFPILTCGGTLVVANAQGHKDPAYMCMLMQTFKVTHFVVAPDVLDVLLDIHEASRQMASLESVISVGSGLPVATANRFVKSKNMKAKLHNVYGASESSCTVYTVPEAGLDTEQWPNRCPVGVPQPGCRVLLLDEQRNEVANGEIGEISFGGQLADLYWGKPELTAEKFVVHPQFGRVYYSGDLGHWRGSVLEIAGRKDRQVKIRGVRVEPEEVESALRSYRRHDAVIQVTTRLPSNPRTPNGQQQTAEGRTPLLDVEAGDCQVMRSESVCSEEASLTAVACVATAGQQPELVAFVSPTLDAASMTALKEHLKAKLPPYYVPKHIFDREELPHLPNGKVDVKALSAEASNEIKAIEGKGQVVMDSLGRMRNLSKAALTENAVIHRCYAYWMVGVMCDHYNGCALAPGMPFCFIDYLPGYVPGWVEMFMRQVGNDQDMFGFIFLGALQDSRMDNGGPTRVTLGYNTVFSFCVYLAAGWPIPQLLALTLGGDGNQFLSADCSDQWVSANCSGHRWYLFMIVYAQVCIFLFQCLVWVVERLARVRIPVEYSGAMQGVMHLIIAVYSPNYWYDICMADGTSKWVQWTGGWVFPYAFADYQSGTYSCPMMQNWIQWYVVFYVLAFYFSRPGMKILADFFNKNNMNTAAWAFAAYGFATMLGATMSVFHYPNIIMEDGIKTDGLKWWYVPLEFGANTVQPLVLALAMAWFPLDCRWWGNTTLGTYVFHFYFLQYAMEKYPKILQWMGEHHLEGVPQVFVLLAIPMLFMTFLGPIFHYILLAPGLLYLKTMSVCQRRRAARAVVTQSQN
eukprot:TRINITY_DN2192_c2_g1_i1.p1 TRINITY_DN2192_c2_g1~~TRINITY_DN2192_c2_g1_i1.p1  ORF type:complete len:1124 (+),score=197.03 TRINITY_DN2192_c2_g1_i1:103-3474(+)